MLAVTIIGYQAKMLILDYHVQHNPITIFLKYMMSSV